MPRGQGAALVAKAAGIASPAPTTPTFSDVDPSSLHYGSIEAISAACVTQGCGGTEFCPNREMIRAEAAVFIARAFDLNDINPCIGGQDAGADAAPDAGDDSKTGGGVWTDSGVGPLTGGAGGAAGSSGAGGRGDTTADDSGCGCSTPRGGAPRGALALLAALALLGLRRQPARGKGVRPA